jgi:hypothetical protein
MGEAEVADEPRQCALPQCDLLVEQQDEGSRGEYCSPTHRTAGRKQDLADLLEPGGSISAAESVQVPESPSVWTLPPVAPPSPPAAEPAAEAVLAGSWDPAAAWVIDETSSLQPPISSRPRPAPAGPDEARDADSGLGRRTMAGMAIAGLLASSAGYFLFHDAAAPDGALPPNTVRPVPDPDEQATRAKVVLASLDRELDDVERTEAQLTNIPLAHSGSETPIAVQALQARKTALIERRKLVAAQLSALIAQSKDPNQRSVAQAGPGSIQPVGLPKPNDQLGRDIAGLGPLAADPGRPAAAGRGAAGLDAAQPDGQQPAAPGPIDRTAPVVATASSPFALQPFATPQPAVSDRAPVESARSLDDLLAPRNSSPVAAVAPRQEPAGPREGIIAALPSPSDRPTDGFFPTSLIPDRPAANRPVGKADRVRGGLGLPRPVAEQSTDARQPQSKLDRLRSQVDGAKGLDNSGPDRDSPDRSSADRGGASDETANNKNDDRRSDESTTDKTRAGEREGDQRHGANGRDKDAPDATDNRPDDNRPDDGGRTDDRRSDVAETGSGAAEDVGSASQPTDGGTADAGVAGSDDQRTTGQPTNDRTRVGAPQDGAQDTSGGDQQIGDADRSGPRQDQRDSVADPNTRTDDRSSGGTDVASAADQRDGNSDKPAASAGTEQDGPARASGAGNDESNRDNPESDKPDTAEPGSSTRSPSSSSPGSSTRESSTSNSDAASNGEPARDTTHDDKPSSDKSGQEKPTQEQSDQEQSDQQKPDQDSAATSDSGDNDPGSDVSGNTGSDEKTSRNNA